MDRRRASLLVGCVAAILVGGAVVWYEMPATRPDPSHQGAIPEKWEFTATGAVAGALALGDDGTLYVTSVDGFLYALDSSGKLQWKFEAGRMQSGPTLGPDGIVYLENSEELIYAVDHSGNKVWSTGGGPYADTNIGSVAAAADWNDLYTFWRGGLRALHLSDGKIDWSAGTGFKNYPSVSILPNGRVVYPGVGRIDAVDSDGRTVWQYPAIDPPLTTDVLLRNGGRPPQGNFWLESGIAVGADGTLYAGAGDSRMVAISPSGTFVWEFKTKPGSINRATPLIAQDGTIYFGSGDGNLYALDANGNQRWALDAGAAIDATPLLAEDGTIYVLNNTGLRTVSPEGKELAHVDINAAIEVAPTLGPDGTVYVGCHTGKILAFAGNHGGLMKSPWPKFQADLANSGRASR